MRLQYWQQSTLASPRILVTRPPGQADDLCAALTADGFITHHLPMLQLVALEKPTASQSLQLRELDQFQHIIFISGNAVRYGMAWIAPHWPSLPRGPHWYAVGAATARQLLSYGIRACSPVSDMTSEGLLALPQLQQLAEQRVLLVKGEGGRGALAAELGRRGGRVEELICYRRISPEMQPGEVASHLLQWDISLVMISSGEGLANMLALLSPAETTKFSHITFLVPSPRVAEIARQAGFSSVVIAENASDSAMLRALAAWQTTVGE